MVYITAKFFQLNRQFSSFLQLLVSNSRKNKLFAAESMYSEKVSATEVQIFEQKTNGSVPKPPLQHDKGVHNHKTNGGDLVL